MDSFWKGFEKRAAGLATPGPIKAKLPGPMQNKFPRVGPVMGPPKVTNPPLKIPGAAQSGLAPKTNTVPPVSMAQKSPGRL
jgi:hypothetical protein